MGLRKSGRAARQSAPDCSLSENDAGIIAVIKADGYGHGAVMLAREMDEIPEVIGYAVATEEEAVLLVDAGIKKPVMVLGYTFPEAYEEMALRGVHATVFTDQMLEDMNRAAQKAGKKCMFTSR